MKNNKKLIAQNIRLCIITILSLYGIKQKTLCEHIKIKQESFCGYLNGGIHPTICSLLKIADALGISMDLLVDRGNIHDKSISWKKAWEFGIFTKPDKSILPEKKNIIKKESAWGMYKLLRNLKQKEIENEIS